MIAFGLGVCHPWQNDEEGVTGPKWTDVQRQFSDLPWYNYKWDRIGAKGYFPMIWRPTTMSPDPMVVHDNPGVTWLWGNEPEDKGQGFMTVEDAVQAWEVWFHSTRHLGILTVGPNVQWTNPAGMEWLDQWLDALDAASLPLPDALGIHLYWQKTAQAYLAEWGRIREWHKARALDVPICITETNAYDYPGVQATGIQLAIAQLVREDPILCGAFWFSTRYPNWSFSDLMTAGGDLTILGENWKRFNEYVDGAKVFLPFASKS